METRTIDGVKVDFTEDEAIVYDTIVKVQGGLMTPLEATQYFISIADKELEEDLVPA